MDTTSSELGNNGKTTVYPPWRPDADRPLTTNLKRKERTRNKISQGYINGSLQSPPLSNFIPDSKKHLRVGIKKTVVLN